MTITTYSRTDGATTLSRMNFCGYVRHVTIFSGMLTIACCLVVGLGLALGLNLVTGWLVVILLCVVIVTLPVNTPSK